MTKAGGSCSSSEAAELKNFQAVLQGLLKVLLVMACFLPDSKAWHAWVDHEAPPTVRDGDSTHGVSDIVMPQLTRPDGSSGLDGCSTATASMQRVSDSQVCRSTSSCDLSCAAAWNSALRDAQAVVGTDCYALEVEINRTYALSVSLSAPFSASEWQILEQDCQVKCGSFTVLDACVVSESYRLSPPTGVCPTFSVTNGDYRYNSLITWNALDYYVAQDFGCVGGLSGLADDEHKTWACIHEPECYHLYNYDDLACFKYSEVRGEFHWWGLNSELQMVPALFQVEASFCHSGAHGSIRNARDASEVDPVGISYFFQRYGPDGTSRESFRGLVAELGDFGCGSFNMRKDAKYWLELEAPGYYPFRGWYYTPSDNFVVVASMFPVLEPTDPAFCSVGITMHWCPQAARDMDIYLFRPRSGGDGSTGFESSDAIYWAYLQETILGPNGTAKTDTYLELESNEGPWNDIATYGPESILMLGDLPTGVYAVLATRWDEDPDMQEDPLVGTCSTVSLYAPASFGDFVNSTTIGEKGTTGNWWYIYNVYIEEQTADTILVSYSFVDEMVNPGPEVDDDGNFVGAFPSAGISLLNGGPKVEMFSYHRVRRECGSFGLIAVSVRNARNSEEIQHAVFSINDDPNTYSFLENKAFLGSDGKIVGGIFYLEGDYVITCSADGYLSKSLPLSVRKENIPNYVEVYLVPRDNRTHVVLSWGEVSTDLDIYVVPRGVEDFQRKAVEYTDANQEIPSMNRPCDLTYVYWGLGNDDFCGCEQSPTNANDCVANCVLVADDRQYRPRLSLDRDDVRSDELNDIGRVSYGPETVTMERLFPGRYHLYVNAYQSFPPSSEFYDPDDTDDVFEDEVEVEVFFGDGTESTTLIETVTFSSIGAKWQHVGYIEVTNAATSGCRSSLAKRQKDTLLTDPELCYEWVTVNDVIGLDDYPFEEVGRAGVEVLSATSSQILDTSTFRVGDIFRNYLVSPNRLSFTQGQGYSGGVLFDNTSVTLYVEAADYLSHQEPVALTCAAPPTFRTVFLLPNDGLTRLVLRWGSRPADLDFYVVPQQVLALHASNTLVSWENLDTNGGYDTPQTHTDGELPYAYWDIDSEFGCPCKLIGRNNREGQSIGADYIPEISLDRDDRLHSSTGSQDGFPPQNGPETVTMKDLLPGTYHVYINAYPEIPDTHPSPPDRDDAEVFPPEKVFVDVYLGDRQDTEWRHTVEIQAPTNTVWWYVGYLLVHQGQCTGQLSRMQQETAFVAIPDAVQPLCYTWFTTPAPDGDVPYPLGKKPLAVRVFSAVDSARLDASVRINGVAPAYREADYGFTEVTGSGFLGGLYLLQGQDSIAVSHTDISVSPNLAYIPQTVQTVAGQDFQYVFLLPNDGETRFVLNWGATPSDLDFYLVPINVTDTQGATMGWLADDGLPPMTNNGDSESPYVFWSVSEYSCPCQLLGDQSGGYNPVLSLDRDDREHGTPDLNTQNGPETITVTHLLPGTYQLYVNAYPPETSSTPTFVAGETVSVQVYLGQGDYGTTDLVETVQFTYANGKWQYIGYLEVFGESMGCSSPLQRVQQDSGPVVNQTEKLCYSWNTVNENRAEYPLTSIGSTVQSRVKSAVDSGPLAAEIKVSGRVKGTTTIANPQPLVAVSLRPTIDIITITANQHVTRTLAGSSLQGIGFKTFFMVPNNGATTFVLHWGESPANLDFYLLPVGVTSLAGSSVSDWYHQNGGNASTHVQGEQQYLYYDVNPAGNCPCDLAANLPTGFSPTLTLDRAEQDHGAPSASRDNGPETISVRQMLPGLYRLYVNAFPPFTTGQFAGSSSAVFGGPVDVEIFLGSGAGGTTALRETVQFNNPGGAWQYIGYLTVSNSTNCDGVLQQDSPPGSVLCHSWTTVNQPVASYPMT